jgi:hypothetical protein
MLELRHHLAVSSDAEAFSTAELVVQGDLRRRCWSRISGSCDRRPKMIDVIMCIRRRADVPAEDFRRYWLEEHGELVKKSATTIGAVRYVQHHTLDTGLEEIVQSSRGAPADRFDGIAVVTFDSLDDMATKGAEPDALAAAEALLADEATFIDHERSLIWFAEHHDVLS